MSSVKIEIPIEASAIKPKRLMFMDESNIKTAATTYMIPDFELACTNNPIFDLADDYTTLKSSKFNSTSDNFNST